MDRVLTMHTGTEVLCHSITQGRACNRQALPCSIYDAVGNVATETNAKGVSTTYTYDANYNLTAMKDAYDGNYNMVKKTTVTGTPPASTPPCTA